MMEIRRIEEIEEISTIFKIDDDRLEKNVGCSKAEWVQYLLIWAEHPDKLGIFGSIDEKGNIHKYFACINAVMPPVSQSIYIMYQNFYDDNENGLVALELIKQWAKECGANKIAIQTRYPNVNSKFGFYPDKAIAMIMDL